jgi:broad specificity phosphatase PhoE
VRHGRTAWNAEKRFQGRSDVALDDVGRSQAEALGRALRHEPFERAIASDLARARATAEIVLAGRTPAVALEIEPGWREFDFGAWEGLTWSEIAVRFPEVNAHAAGGRFVSPAGSSESFDGLCTRVAAALATLCARPVSRALVVTHAGPLHALLRLAYGSEREALAARFLPASVSRFRVAAGIVSVLRINEFAA